jgi:hypothetical protein
VERGQQEAVAVGGLALRQRGESAVQALAKTRVARGSELMGATGQIKPQANTWQLLLLPARVSLSDSRQTCFTTVTRKEALKIQP